MKPVRWRRDVRRGRHFRRQAAEVRGRESSSAALSPCQELLGDGERDFRRRQTARDADKFPQSVLSNYSETRSNTAENRGGGVLVAPKFDARRIAQLRVLPPVAASRLAPRLARSRGRKNG